MMVAGCAQTLTTAESKWMIQQEHAWKARIDFYAPLAQAAYRDSDVPLPTGYIRPIIPVPHAPARASIAYAFGTDEVAHKHFIGIEGTRDLSDLMIDAKAVRREDSRLTIPVHPGFEAVATAVYQDLKVQQRLKTGYAVGLTGHSLGGAVAVLLAMRFDKDNTVVDEVVTFGQPMVTDNEGIAAFNALLERTVRVVACDDVVPFLPPIGYTHGGSVLLLLDSARFEFARQDVTRPFVVALRDDLRHLIEAGRPFYGHRMADYGARLKLPRTKPWRYTELDPRYCSGR